MKKLMLVLAAAGLSAMTPELVLRAATTNVDAAFKAFWDAPTTAAAEKTVHGIIESGITFDDAWTRLKAGRSYAKEKTGLIRQPVTLGGESFETLIEIPAEYDAAKKWPLRVQLHGGVGRPPQAGPHRP